MEFKNLLIDNSEGVALLTINSPRTLNALNSEVLGELECALYELAHDAAVKAVIVTGAGEKAFVAGADIKEMSAMTAYEGHQFGLKGQRVMLAIEKMGKPVIAAVNGFALGGGAGAGPGLRFHLRLGKGQGRLSRGDPGDHARLWRDAEPGEADRSQQGQRADIHREDDHCPEGL